MALLDRTSEWQVWIPAVELPDIYYTTGTWTRTRNAAGDYYNTVAAADATSTIELPISHIVFRDVSGLGAGRGIQLRGFTYMYFIGTAAMDAHTYDMLETTYANTTAPAVSTTVGGTLSGTLATATNAQPYLTRVTFGTPYFMRQDRASYIQITANRALTTVYRVYGAFLDLAWVSNQ